MPRKSIAFPQIGRLSRKLFLVEFSIKLDDLSSPAIADLLSEHLHDMYEQSPPGSVHALDLDLDDLKKPEITFWAIWEGEALVGCGALKELSAEHGEIKSMRTAKAYRGKGAGKLIVRHIIDEARTRNYNRLSLETGSMAFFDPARRLYESHGFTYCGPFADYTLDPNSVFMTMEL
jgi:putative acetyltransferase